MKLSQIIAVVALFSLLNSESYASIRSKPFSWPESGRFKEAAKSAWELDQFQVPFVAGILSIIFLDGEVSRKATQEGYLFQNQENAQQWSDTMLLSLLPIMIYSGARAQQSGDSNEFVFRTKLYSFFVATLAIDFFFIGLLKDSTGRIRPDDTDLKSLPSGHSSISAALSRLTVNNLDNSSIKDTLQAKILKTSAITLSGLVAWARVEGKKHHLSDVLLGHSIGAFVSDFLFKSFLVDGADSLETQVYLQPHEAGLSVSYAF